MKRLTLTEGNARASLAGSKTETRRKVRAKHGGTLSMDPIVVQMKGGRRIPVSASRVLIERWHIDDARGFSEVRPPYAVGETVALTLPYWRKEDGSAWIWDEVTKRLRIHDTTDNARSGRIIQITDPPGIGYIRKAPEFMPVWAATHVATIQAVRVERLGEISDADCAREGLYPCPLGWRYPGETAYAWPTPGDAYRAQWEALHGAGSWHPDEWVWVHSFGDVRPASCAAANKDSC